ncbi:MAG: DUF4388 domain-containing protein [Pseudomonadota bacterium]
MNTTSCMILLVDVDQAKAKTLSMNLKECGHAVLTARDGAHAMSILQYRAFDVLIIDVAVSRVGNTDLIDWAAKLCPRPRIAAMGNPCSQTIQQMAYKRGAGVFLTKPVDINKLLEFLTPGRGTSSFSGTVLDVDIVEYVQFLLLSGKRVVLKVTSSLGTAGRIFVSAGLILHAECGVLLGTQALLRCLCFKEGTFSHEPWEEPESNTINKPGDYLLMEAVRKRDEAWGSAFDE